MDSLHAIGFYVSAGLSVAGGLSVAFLPDRPRRALALAVAGLGISGVYLSLSAPLASLVALICYAGCTALASGSGYRIVDQDTSGRWRQIGAAASAVLLAVIAYSAFGGQFLHADFLGDSTRTMAVGRLLFAHDAMATDAIGALALVALVGATAAWRARDRRS